MLYGPQYGISAHLAMRNSMYPSGEPIDPIELGMRDLADSRQMREARQMVLAEYQAGDAEQLAHQCDNYYLPALAGTAETIIRTAEQQGSRRPIESILIARGITTMIGHERARRLEAIDKRFGTDTGAWRNLTRTHYRRGPVVKLAQGLEIRPNPWAISDTEYNSVHQRAAAAVGLEHDEVGLDQIDIQAVALRVATVVVSKQIEGECELLASSIAAERARKRR